MCNGCLMSGIVCYMVSLFYMGFCDVFFLVVLVLINDNQKFKVNCLLEFMLSVFC